jgi:glycine dehydrogenase subunit 2
MKLTRSLNFKGDEIMATVIEPTIFELSSPGRRGVKMPASDVPTTALPPKDLLRSDLPLPELAEVDVVRHYMKLSKFNYSVDERLLSFGFLHHEIQPEDQRRHLPLPGFLIHASIAAH